MIRGILLSVLLVLCAGCYEISSPGEAFFEGPPPDWSDYTVLEKGEPVAKWELHTENEFLDLEDLWLDGAKSLVVMVGDHF